MVFEGDCGRYIMENTTTAVNLLNSITELKLQKVVEEYLIPNSISQFQLKKFAEKELRIDAENYKGMSLEEVMAEIAEERPAYRRNPDFIFPDFLDVREKALFLYMLLTYWGNRGFKAVPDCGYKLTEIMFKPNSSCGSCKNGRRFMIALFGKDYINLPFIEGKGSIYNNKYVFITAESLREFAYS